MVLAHRLQVFYLKKVDICSWPYSSKHGAAAFRYLRRLIFLGEHVFRGDEARTIETVTAMERTIGEISALYGVSMRTLRFYEDKGLLSPRREGTRRFYSAGDCIKLQVIMKGKQLGFTLHEIRAIISAKDVRAGSRSGFIDSLDEERLLERIRQLQRQRDTLDDAIRELRVALAKTG